MLKPALLTLILVSFLQIAASAQARDTIWMDARGNVSTTHLYAFATKQKTDSGWLLSMHYHNGNLRMVGNYDDSLARRQGVSRWYFQDGTPFIQQTFVRDTVNGTEQRFYDDGKLQMEGVRRDTRVEGEWRAYFPSGKLAAKTEFVGGERGKTTLYNEDGTVNTRDTVFYRGPEYPGGPAQFLKFLISRSKKVPTAGWTKRRCG